MNESNMNSNIETKTEENITPAYSSEFIMNKELFYEFYSVSYNRIKKWLFALLFVCAGTVVSYFFEGNYDSVIGLGVITTIIMSILLFRLKRAIKINYERNLISAGKESSFHHELFEDKIVSYIEGVKREYFYYQITKFYETKNLILLHLKHNLYITINKNTLSASADEVKSFLMRRCSLVKKNRFVNCSDDKKWSLAFFISLIVICVVGVVAGIAVPAVYNKPVHFRDIEFSTTRSDIQKLYGKPGLETDDEYCDRYEVEILGVDGRLEFMYLRDGETLYSAQFLIDSYDFKSYTEYQAAVNKTYKHFHKTLSRYQSMEVIDEYGINAIWSKKGDNKESYSMYSTRISDLRGLTTFQYENVIYQGV